MMHRQLAILLYLMLLAALAVGSPGGASYLARNKVLCDTERVVCLRATVAYEEANFTVQGRVTKIKSPGTLQFIFRPRKIDQEKCGIVFDDYAVVARLEINLSGHLSQIVDAEASSGYSACITDWKLCCIVFQKEGDESVRCLPAECAD